jgi:hypothetical protein
MKPGADRQRPNEVPPHRSQGPRAGGDHVDDRAASIGNGANRRAQRE